MFTNPSLILRNLCFPLYILFKQIKARLCSQGSNQEGLFHLLENSQSDPEMKTRRMSLKRSSTGTESEQQQPRWQNFFIMYVWLKFLRSQALFLQWPTGCGPVMMFPRKSGSKHELNWLAFVTCHQLFIKRHPLLTANHGCVRKDPVRASSFHFFSHVFEKSIQ